MFFGRHSIRLFIGAIVLLTTGAAFGQPYNAWLTNSSGHGYIQLPNSSSLDFSGGSFTFEAWVALADSNGTSGCSSIAGNSFFESSWIGVCGTQLRSYLSGGGSSYTIGVVPANDWTHIAVTFDSVTNTHSHYVDGELAGQRTSDGIPASTFAWRIFSDPSWAFTPNGAIDEVRFWDVARTTAEIRSTINKEIDAATPGLVAVYELDGDATDAIGALHGTKVGASANYLNAAVSSGCTTTASTLCVGPGGRFAVSSSFKTASTSGNGGVVPFSTTDSGLFWFFAPTNWEVMTKVLNGCGVNNRWWVFNAGLTDQHFEIVVSDMPTGVTKRYFNYSGVPAPPIQDVDAFATCP